MHLVYIECTIIVISFRTDRSGQTVQTQIRLLLEEPDESDEGLHCLQFNLHLFDKIPFPYPKCPPLQLISTRISCGHLTDVHAEYWNTMSATSARRRKKNYQKKRADVSWNSCRTILRMQRTSVGHSVPILRIRWNFMQTSARMSVGRPPECPSDVRRMSVGRPPECPLDVLQNVRRTSAECPLDVRRTSAMSAQKNICEISL